ncbi:MAG TPA: GlsB/YeaQ/YmgE family stress response membrane protein [Bacilli bacterium]
MISLLISFIVAIVVGFIGNDLMKSKSSMPGGIFDSMIAAFAGAWLGNLILGSWGPVIGGFAILPAIIGAAALVFLLGFTLSTQLVTSSEEQLLNN